MTAAPAGIVTLAPTAVIFSPSTRITWLAATRPVSGSTSRPALMAVISARTAAERSQDTQTIARRLRMIASCRGESTLVRSWHGICSRPGVSRRGRAGLAPEAARRPEQRLGRPSLTDQKGACIMRIPCRLVLALVVSLGAVCVASAQDVKPPPPLPEQAATPLPTVPGEQSPAAPTRVIASSASAAARPPARKIAASKPNKKSAETTSSLEKESGSKAAEAAASTAAAEPATNIPTPLAAGATASSETATNPVLPENTTATATAEKEKDSERNPEAARAGNWLLAGVAIVGLAIVLALVLAGRREKANKQLSIIDHTPRIRHRSPLTHGRH